MSDCIDPLERQQIQRWTAQLIPLELMGSHIASGHSHTTGRIHSLSFRAATAVFGHLGIEWNLARATPDELDELREWIEFFKAERELLFGGNYVRLDFPDESVTVNGVVAPDGARAIYAVASCRTLGSRPAGQTAAARPRFGPPLLGASVARRRTHRRAAVTCLVGRQATASRPLRRSRRADAVDQTGPCGASRCGAEWRRALLNRPDGADHPSGPRGPIPS